MKVILTRDVKGVGRAHDSVTTADGYALNFLIPKKLAVPATPTSLQEAELRRKQTADRSLIDVALVAQNLATLAETHIVIKMKANDKGHLYDAVGELDILKAAKEQAHVEIPIDAIKIDKPFKELGTFDVPVSAAGAFEISITIELSAEDRH
jgi:large subunit ribosomal protein L9